MSIDIKDLKDIDERFLYVTRQSLLKERVIEFLKTNKDKGFLSQEIFEEMQKLQKEDMESKVDGARVMKLMNRSTVVHLLNKYVKEYTVLAPISKKGSYYFYNENKKIKAKG